MRHANTAVEWLASGTATVDGESAVLTLNLDESLIEAPACVEVRAHDDSDRSIALDKAFFTRGPDGWQFTPERPKELEAVRAAYFAQPLIAPNATNARESFRAVALIEGLLVTENTRVPGIDIYALQRPLHTEQATVDLLSDVSGEVFGSTFSTGTHPDRGLPCVALKLGDLQADTFEAALQFAHDLASRMADLLGFNRGGRPEVMALAVFDKDRQSGSVRYWVNQRRSQYTGNLVGGFIAGEATGDLVAQWSRAQTDARLPLWLSQVNDARAEPRWEYRILRHFNLLEGMSKDSLGKNVPVLDAQGQQLLQSNGLPYTTEQARGAVYMVIAGLCRFRGDFSEDGFCSHTPLWDLCQYWTTVRNQVAHSGAWDSGYKVRSTDKVEAFLRVAPDQRRAELGSVLAQCVDFVIDGIIFRNYLPL